MIDAELPEMSEEEEDELLSQQFIEIATPAIFESLKTKHRVSLKHCRAVAEDIITALKAHRDAEEAAGH